MMRGAPSTPSCGPGTTRRGTRSACLQRHGAARRPAALTTALAAHKACAHLAARQQGSTLPHPAPGVRRQREPGGGRRRPGPRSAGVRAAAVMPRHAAGRVGDAGACGAVGGCPVCRAAVMKAAGGLPSGCSSVCLVALVCLYLQGAQPGVAGARTLPRLCTHHTPRPRRAAGPPGVARCRCAGGGQGCGRVCSGGPRQGNWRPGCGAGCPGEGGR